MWRHGQRYEISHVRVREHSTHVYRQRRKAGPEISGTDRMWSSLSRLFPAQCQCRRHTQTQYTYSVYKYAICMHNDILLPICELNTRRLTIAAVTASPGSSKQKTLPKHFRSLLARDRQTKNVHDRIHVFVWKTCSFFSAFLCEIEHLLRCTVRIRQTLSNCLLNNEWDGQINDRYTELVSASRSRSLQSKCPPSVRAAFNCTFLH